MVTGMVRDLANVLRRLERLEVLGSPSGSPGASGGDAGILLAIDNGDSALEAGQHSDLEVPFDFTIESVTLLAEPPGAVVVDLWATTYAGFPPTDANSITSATPPTIVATADKSQDATLSGWTTSLTKGDCLRANVDSATTITRVSIGIKGRRVGS